MTETEVIWEWRRISATVETIEPIHQIKEWQRVTYGDGVDAPWINGLVQEIVEWVCGGLCERRDQHIGLPGDCVDAAQ
jgi:hypothetical protein